MTTSSRNPETPRTAAILVIGNEVLSGKVVDANSPFLLKELYALGVKVQRVMVIPDELDVIADEVREASRRYDFVFTSGGVGPTHDDVTMKGIAMAFGVELREQPTIMALLEKHFSGRVNDAARRMAMLPDGVELLWSGELPFPTSIMHNVYIFPGVPELLRAKFESLRERFRDSPYHLVRIFTHQGESVLAEHLEDTLVQYPGIEIGSYPRYDTQDYKVMLTLESKDRAQLTRARDHLLHRMQQDQLVQVEDELS